MQAGANKWLSRGVMQSNEAKDRIKTCSASGIHVLSIPQYVVGNIVNCESTLRGKIKLTPSVYEAAGAVPPRENREKMAHSRRGVESGRTRREGVSWE